MDYDYNGDGTPDRSDHLNELGVNTKDPILDAVDMDWETLRKENAEAVTR